MKLLLDLRQPIQHLPGDGPQIWILVGIGDVVQRLAHAAVAINRLQKIDRLHPDIGIRILQQRMQHDIADIGDHRRHRA